MQKRKTASFLSYNFTNLNNFLLLLLYLKTFDFYNFFYNITFNFAIHNFNTIFEKKEGISPTNITKKNQPRVLTQLLLSYNRSINVKA